MVGSFPLVAVVVRDTPVGAVVGASPSVVVLSVVVGVSSVVGVVGCAVGVVCSVVLSRVGAAVGAVEGTATVVLSVVDVASSSSLAVVGDESCVTDVGSSAARSDWIGLASSLTLSSWRLTAPS